MTMYEIANSHWTPIVVLLVGVVVGPLLAWGAMAFVEFCQRDAENRHS